MSFARACRLMGPAGSGQLTKMINQICIAGLVQGLAEGIHFGSEPVSTSSSVPRRDLSGAADPADGKPRPHDEPGQFDFGFAVD